MVLSSTFPLTYDSDLGDIRRPFFDNLIREKHFHHLEVTKEVAQIAKSQDRNLTTQKSAAMPAHSLPLYPCYLTHRLRYDMQHYSM